MKPRNLIIASVILAALAGAVFWATKHPAAETGASATPAAPKLADIPESQIQQVDITKKGSPAVILQRENGSWMITAPEQYRADQGAVTTLLSTLNPLNADSVVEDKPTDIGKYGLVTPTLTATVHEKGGKIDQLLIGNDIPAGSLVYARLGSSPKVYALSNSVKTSLDKGLNDLRDKRLLTFDTAKLTRVQLVSSKGAVEFGKNGSGEWQMIKPQPYRVDNSQVEELVRKLGDAKMDLAASPEDQKKADAAFASGQTVSTVKVTDASGTQILDVRKNKDDYYARSSVVKGDYKIPSDLGQALDKSVDDFRNKKLFDFGFSDPKKVGIQQGASDKTYVLSGRDWKLDGQTMDPGTVQSFIDKLRDLAATKFVTTGFTTPAAAITVTAKTTEKVEFSKSPDGYVARRENEPTLYQLDAKTVDAILEAGKAIKPAASSAKK
jgi:hypothetical protein